MNKLPDDIQQDIAIAKLILFKYGCKAMYLFGSLVDGTFTERSDIDIAVIGIRKADFFKVYGEILHETHRSIDLICLDFDTDFSKQLKETGKFEQVA